MSLTIVVLTSTTCSDKWIHGSLSPIVIGSNNGQTRQWITRSSANVAEDTSEQPAAKGSKKKGKTPKKSNDLDDALLQQHKDLVSAIRSLSTTTETPAPEPAPEPAPAPTMSHSSMTAALLQAALDRTTRPATAQMAERRGSHLFSGRTAATVKLAGERAQQDWITTDGQSTYKGVGSG